MGNDPSTASRVVASALLSATMLGVPGTAYPFFHGRDWLGIGALVAMACAFIGFRRLSRGTYSRRGATFAALVAMVTVVNLLTDTAVGRPGAYRTVPVEAGLLFFAWLCGFMMAVVGSLIPIKTRSR